MAETRLGSLRPATDAVADRRHACALVSHHMLLAHLPHDVSVAIHLFTHASIHASAGRECLPDLENLPAR